MTSISGFVTMILEGKAGAVDEKQKHFLEIVRKQTKYLKGMIESMLDFSRIETGRLELNPELLTVGEVVTEIVADMEPQIHEKELVIEIDCKDAGCKVLADRIRLGRAFSNVFGNAIKFTPRGRKIKVEVAEEKGFISVSVIDGGIGISKEYLEKIFEKFFQIDSALTRVVGGAGMGLSIAKEIIEKHGGRIWAESEGVGKGAKLMFNLPRA
jgi:signal transduction histidine kinase